MKQNIYDIKIPIRNGFNILRNDPNQACTLEKLSNILYTITTVIAINNHDILFFHPCFISSIYFVPFLTTVEKQFNLT